MIKHYFFWFSILSSLTFPLIGNGQSDSLWIDTINVTAKKIRYNQTGGTTKQWITKDLQTLPSNNLGELLSNEAGVFIKNYGTGSLSTSSIRGGSAGHTLVVWNGVPLQSPMLGLLDLSLLPLNGPEEIVFQAGGSSATWGSGAIGGVIHLNNRANYNNTFSFSNSIKIGSFGQLQEQIKISLGNKKFQSVTKLFYQKADNDFPFLIAPTLPEKTQTNAQFSEQNILQDFYWKINQKNQVVVHLWQQFSNKHIPPTIVQNLSLAEQDDLATRLSLDWKRISDRSILSAKLSYINEQNNYFDVQYLTEAKNQFRRWISEIENEWSWNNTHRLLIGLTHGITQASSDGYEGSPTENRLAQFASYQFEKEMWQLQAGIRQELVDGKLTPTVPNLGINFQAFPFLLLKFKVSKNYRTATLNDKYWFPVGNVNLLPENGWSQEQTAEFNFKKQDIYINFSNTFYSRKISNWIRWGVEEGQSFWAPSNLSKVWSRGLESRFTLNYQKENLNLRWTAGYDLTHSTNLIASTLPKIAKGEQLWYTPLHQGVTRLNFKWKKISASYQHQFIGSSDGFNEVLPSYDLGNTSLQYAFSFKKCNNTVFLNINNIWNTSYIVVERRPMPRRNFQIGWNFNFSK